MIDPQPGDVWLTQLDPTVGHEQRGLRPAVVVSSSAFQSMPIRMAIIVPLTGKDRGLVTEPRIARANTGLTRVSLARPEDVRSVDTARFQRRLGHVDADELAAIRGMLRYFLAL